MDDSAKATRAKRHWIVSASGRMTFGADFGFLGAGLQSLALAPNT